MVELKVFIAILVIDVIFLLGLIKGAYFNKKINDDTEICQKSCYKCRKYEKCTDKGKVRR